MEDMRNELMRLMGELGVTQADLVRWINGSPSVPYNVTPPEMSGAVRGTLATPKAARVVADCTGHLEKIKRRLDAKAAK